MLHSTQSISALSSGSRQLNLTRSLHPESSEHHGPILFTPPKLHSHSQGIILSYFSNSSIQTKAGGSDEPFEAHSSLSLDSRLRASEATPEPNEIEKLQYRVCELQKNGQEAAAAAPATPSFLTSPFRAVRGGDTIWPSFSHNGSVVSRTSSPTISMPVDSDSTQASHPIHPWESSRSKEERSRNSSCAKELIEDGRIHNPGALKRKLSSSSASTGKTSTITHHEERHYNNRPAVSKKEISTSNKDVDISMAVADIEDPSDDEGEDGPGVSEKRRKRMLSNRASAQRSRQRRQERLDTLEVLVAELRVKNAALTWRANSAATAAKKLVEENNLLRDRLRIVPSSDRNASNESDKTTEISNMIVNNNSESCWRPDIGSSGDNSPSLSRASTGALTDKRDDRPVENSKRWNIINSGTSFNQDLMENATCLEISGNVLPDNSRGADVKELYQSAIISLAQNSSFQSRHQFGIDLGQGNLEMDNTSRHVEDVWEEGLSGEVLEALIAAAAEDQYFFDSYLTRRH